jgi:hypothetical protein
MFILCLFFDKGEVDNYQQFSSALNYRGCCYMYISWDFNGLINEHL